MPEPNVPESPIMSQSEAEKFSPEQFQAIQLFLVGKSNTEVAEALGKDRRTIYRWKQNPHFLAELNVRCKEIHEAAQIQLHGLLRKAISVIERQLDQENNLKAAMEVLRLLNVTPKMLKPDHETDAEAIAAREAEKLAICAFNATPFAQNNMIIGVYPDEKQRALADDIFGLIKEKYKVSTKLGELID